MKKKNGKKRSVFDEFEQTLLTSSLVKSIQLVFPLVSLQLNLGGEKDEPVSYRSTDDELRDKLDGNFRGEIEGKYWFEDAVHVDFEQFRSSLAVNELNDWNVEETGDFLPSQNNLAAKSSPSWVSENLYEQKYWMRTTN